MAKKVKLTIVGMHCSSCAMNIDGDLEDFVEGVTRSETSYVKQECIVEVEDHVTIEQLVTQIKETGYQAEVSE